MDIEFTPIEGGTMFSRIRVALGVALLATLMISITAFAKGNFAFVSIVGPNLKETVRSTDPALTMDFLAFFDFSNRVEAPKESGAGYLVTRYYVDNDRETAFDQLHYYPDTGLVYYDGIVNGGSEYDGKWYTAKPEIKAAFEKALPGDRKFVAPAVQQPVISPEKPTSKSSPFPSRAITLIVGVAGLVIVLILAFGFRRSVAR
jgi:hypothetical protein